MVAWFPQAGQELAEWAGLGGQRKLGWDRGDWLSFPSGLLLLARGTLILADAIISFQKPIINRKK